MTTGGISSGDDGLSALFEASPDRQVHTSVAAETGLILGLFALFAAPFSVMHGLALGAAALGAVLAFLGVVRTSNHPDVAGRAIAPLGLEEAGVVDAVPGQLAPHGGEPALGEVGVRRSVPQRSAQVRLLTGEEAVAHLAV